MLVWVLCDNNTMMVMVMMVMMVMMIRIRVMMLSKL